MKVLEGIRVVEVTSWLFVPAAGAVLAEWGAEVIKIDHPERPDPLRNMRVAGMGRDSQPLAPMYHLANRGKRSLGMDVGSRQGRDILAQLVADTDVFLTSLLPRSRAKLGLDVDSVREMNPRIIYAKGSGYGPDGPDADAPGFDGTAYWARGGIADSLTPAGAAEPTPSVPAMGDLPAGLTLAGAIAAALLRRERTGETPVVDVSLLGTAVWNAAPAILSSAWTGRKPTRVPREQNPNPATLVYRLRDDRYIKLSLFASDRHFTELCERIGRADIVADPRFTDSRSRAEHHEACIAELDAVFATLTTQDVISRFTGMSGAWSLVRNVDEVALDPQVQANGYVRSFAVDGEDMPTAASPWQFDSATPELSAAPAHGEHTDEILLQLGLDWDALLELKMDGVIV
ncbi:CaiB/BaiF CoA transferase family protein [Mycolicibacterium vinylchloridicum]|uniref:CaiB/BaiF CoA transferase family protein n=1 Tax=Mycolicibacterium vinylchloridicum TaxID=2736928 RepID=UPI0015CA7CD1|nr:CoA transferase [Mycolicibacterium vinylchloridicum]